MANSPMFDENRLNYMKIVYIFIFILCIAALYVCSVFVTFGLVIAKYPDNNRITGCPQNLTLCSPEKKMACYYDDMRFCCGLGVLTAIAILIFLCCIIIVTFLIRYLCGDKELENNKIFYIIFMSRSHEYGYTDKIPLNGNF